MNVINLSLGEPEVEPVARPRRRGDQRAPRPRASSRSSPPGTTSTSSATARSTRPGTRRVRSPSQPSTVNRQIASFSSAGPTPVSLQHEAGRDGPGRSILSSLPAEPGHLGPAERHEHGDTARRRGRRAAQGAAPDVDGRARSSRRSCRRATRRVTTTGQEVLASREGGGFVDLAARRRTRSSSRSRRRSRSASCGAERRRSATVSLTDAGGGAGDWTAP